MFPSQFLKRLCHIGVYTLIHRAWKFLAPWPWGSIVIPQRKLPKQTLGLSRSFSSMYYPQYKRLTNAVRLISGFRLCSSFPLLSCLNRVHLSISCLSPLKKALDSQEVSSAVHLAYTSETGMTCLLTTRTVAICAVHPNIKSTRCTSETHSGIHQWYLNKNYVSEGQERKYTLKIKYHFHESV